MSEPTPPITPEERADELLQARGPAGALAYAHRQYRIAGPGLSETRWGVWPTSQSKFWQAVIEYLTTIPRSST